MDAAIASNRFAIVNATVANQNAVEHGHLTVQVPSFGDKIYFIRYNGKTMIRFSGQPRPNPPPANPPQAPPTRPNPPPPMPFDNNNSTGPLWGRLV